MGKLVDAVEVYVFKRPDGSYREYALEPPKGSDGCVWQTGLYSSAEKVAEDMQLGEPKGSIVLCRLTLEEVRKVADCEYGKVVEDGNAPNPVGPAREAR